MCKKSTVRGRTGLIITRPATYASCRYGKAIAHRAWQEKWDKSNLRDRSGMILVISNESLVNSMCMRVRLLRVRKESGGTWSVVSPNGVSMSIANCFAIH